MVSQKKFNARKTLFYIIIASVIAAFGLLTIYVRQRPYFDLDLTITKEVQEFTPVWFDFLMNMITFIGNPLTSVMLTAITVGFFYLKKRNKEAIMLFVSVLGSTVLSILLKALIHRPRPTPHLVHQTMKYLHNDSFPSGHVMFYVGFFGFLLYLMFTIPVGHKLRTISLAIFTTLILLIGPSRIYVGAHWFSDVIGAYLLGFVILVIVIYIYNRWQPKANSMS